MHPANLTIILLEPQGDLNIGSACRSMMNFGCDDLRLVKPRVKHHTENARRMAVNATSILEKAAVFSDLDSAIADLQLIFGTTRRKGKYRNNLLMPELVAKRIVNADNSIRIGLLFGPEEDGLSNEDLDRCHYMMTIPTSDALPSLNLAQAVTICLYELFRASSSDKDIKNTCQRELASSSELQEMFQHMRTVLLKRGFLDENNPDHILRTFRHIFGRAELDSREVRILRGLWSNLENSSKQSQ